MVYTKVVTNKSPWLAQAELGKVYVNPASHGEGRFVANKEWIDKLFANGQVATQYCDLNGNVSMDEEWNVNGSYAAIEGITSPDGRVLGKMAHSERRGDAVAMNISGEQDIKIFESGVAYFKSEETHTNIFRKVNKSRKTAPKRAVFLCPVFDEK